MQTWDETTAEITEFAEAAGLEWHEVRRAVVREYLLEAPWPEDEGLGSSDQNHILVGEWQCNRAGVLRIIETAAWEKKTLADLAARGIDLHEMAKLFEPVN